MYFPPAPLEDWLRDNYFTAKLKICSSGVEPYSYGEIRQLLDLDDGELDDLVFDDGYSLGTPTLRAAIARRWSDGDPDRVMTACGSSEALDLILRTLLRAGDEVVVVEPGYHSLIGLAEALGCELRRWQLHVGTGFHASLADLEQLVTPGTRAIIVNFPHNPTGTSVSRGEAAQIVALARDVGAYLLWDTAFADVTYDEAPLPNPPVDYERAILVGTMSKSYGLPGLRFGWCIAEPALLEACIRIRDYTILHVSPLVEFVAQRAVERIDALLAPRLEQARTNRSLLLEWVEEQAGRVTLAPPVGGVAGFPRFAGIEDTRPFAQQLLDEHSVLVVPGEVFGEPQHIRLGFGGPTGELVEGLERLGHALRG